MASDVKGCATTVAVAIAVLAAGCDNSNAPASSSLSTASTAVPAPARSRSPSAISTTMQPIDSKRLLITARDIVAPDKNDSYTAQPPSRNPSAGQDAEVLFINQDQTRAVDDLIVILADAGEARNALQQAKTAVAASVAGGGLQPSSVGAGAVVESGMSHDQSKAVSILLFTEGRGVVRLEFDSAPDRSIPATFITDVGQKQDIALRTGLTG